MNKRGARITLQDKHEIQNLMKRRKTDPEIGEILDKSVHTVRKWRRRIEKVGLAGKCLKPGRPRKGALSTYPKKLRNWILHLRETHPGWGPQTILIELQRDCVWSKQDLPSRSRIAAFLKEAGLTRHYLKASDIVQPELKRPTIAHEEWELDAQVGVRVDGLGKVSFIHVLDKASRLKIESTPLQRVRKPNKNHYMLALRRAFLHWGLPARISFDRDTVFYDNTYPSPFPTMIHRWLIALGIEVVFTRRRRPTDHAQIEGSHRTMTAQAIQGQTWQSIESLWKELDDRRDVLNQFMPCKALDGKSPFEAYPDADFSGRPYRLEDEIALLSTKRLFEYLSQGTWFRFSHQGAMSLGGQYYWISVDVKKKSLKICFNKKIGYFEVRPENSEELFYVRPKGMSKHDLMSDLSFLNQLPSYQLPLPLLTNDRSLNQLALMLTGTN